MMMTMKRFVFPCLLALISAAPARAETDVYFGTYTGAESKGIYHSTLNLDTGALTEPTLAAEIASPSFVAIHPNGKFLYAVSESGEGAVSAFAIGADAGLTLLNQQGTGGGGPCHLSLDPAGKALLVANYGGGSVSSYPIAEDGKIGKAGAFIQHEGSSTDPRRQAGPHAHSVNVDPAGKRAFVADLGLDKILVYELDAAAGKITPNTYEFFKFPGGQGPRHLSFHPSGRFVYSNLEMTLEVAAFAHDPETGELEYLGKESTVEEGTPAKGNSTAECLVHPSGKWVYVSNRGPNSIAAFRIDQNTGELAFIEREPTQGEIPRGFGIDPSGKFLVAANQKTGNVAVLRINQDTGELEPTGHGVKVGSPVNVRFLVR